MRRHFFICLTAMLCCGCDGRKGYLSQEIFGCPSKAAIACAWQHDAPYRTSRFQADTQALNGERAGPVLGKDINIMDQIFSAHRYTT